MRVGIVAFLHESNTFVPESTTFDAFRGDLSEGEAVRERYAAVPHEIGGFFTGLAEAGCEAVPILAARALPSGTISTAAYEQIVERLLAAVQKSLPVDGMLVAPHGATVSEAFPDADGEWLTRLRRLVGPRLPIVGTLDPHANLSPAMIQATHALVAYRTNPHLDQHARGVEAARLLVRTLRGEIRPVQAAAFPPLMINIERQATSEPAARGLREAADRLQAEWGLLSTSVLFGFPYADVAEAGSSAIAVADGDASLARRAAAALGQAMWERREEFRGRLIGVEAALERAREISVPKSSGGYETVGLLDMGDNVGGGSPGDGTWLAHGLLQHGPLPALVVLADSAAVGRCLSAGILAAMNLSVGGKTHPRHGPPLELRGRVAGLFDGRFVETQPRHGGFTEFDQGASALFRTDAGLDVLISSRRMVPFSLGQLTSCQLDPARYRAIAIKGVHAPVAAYGPVCRELIRVNTDGLTTADLSRLEFRNRRRPLFPFEAADGCPIPVVEGAAAVG